MLVVSQSGAVYAISQFEKTTSNKSLSTNWYSDDEILLILGLSGAQKIDAAPYDLVIEPRYQLADGTIVTIKENSPHLQVQVDRLKH